VVSRALLCIGTLASACGGRAHPLVSGTSAAQDKITLYRDRAVIEHRMDVVVPEASHGSVSFVVPAGVSVDDVEIVDRGPLMVSELHAPEPPAAPAQAWETDAEEGESDDDEESDLEDDLRAAEPAPIAKPAAPTGPTTITFDVTAPKAGRYGLTVAYVTDQLSWDAAYTMTTTPARTRASLRGAIAIRNKIATPLPTARTYVVDSDLGAWRERLAEQVGGSLTGTNASPSSTPAAVPRLVGDLSLATGETRVELLPGESQRAMHSVLVYDPIGTKLDNSGARPILDASLGTEKASPRVTESFEIVRPHASSEGLPAGPVRLLERRTDGTLAVLGESRLFDAATRVATVDTIALGTADGVTGSRERRELSYDEDGRRLVEEFVLTIKNTRAYPVEVVLREHLYRGQNWTLAYQTASEPTKEGPQQISLRMIAPVRGEAKALYVVVYTGL
jgi:hypothetical protein